MRTIDIADIEAFIRTGLPRATDEEVAALVGRLGGRAIRQDDADLLRPFTDRDTPRDRLGRIRADPGGDRLRADREPQRVGARQGEPDGRAHRRGGRRAGLTSAPARACLGPAGARGCLPSWRRH